jgi:hypothetical protein
MDAQLANTFAGIKNMYSKEKNDPTIERGQI